MDPSSNPVQTEEGVLLRSTLTAGAYAAGIGLLAGGAQGILWSQTPAIAAAAASMQWGATGAAFAGMRTFVIRHDFFRQQKFRADSYHDPSPSSQRERASAFAGGFAGAVNASLFSSSLRLKNFISGCILFSIFGYAGQKGYDYLDSKHQDSKHQDPEEKTSKEKFLVRLVNSNYSPVRVLSDEDYKKMLQEKLLRVETEISLLDESIIKLKQEQEKEQEVSPYGSNK